MTLTSLPAVPGLKPAPAIKRAAETARGPVILASHGSRDPRSAQTMRALANAAALRWGGPVTAAFLDFNPPTVTSALRDLVALDEAPVVVPALLTSAYHGRVDLPEVLRSAGAPTRLTPVLGPAEPGQPADPLLLAALIRRLSEVDASFDGLVLLAAGTSHAPARSTVEGVAEALSERFCVPCHVGYASAAQPDASRAVAQVRQRGARRIAAVAYFLAPGRLYDAAVASARAEGVVGVADPIGAAPELAELVAARAAAA